MRRQISIGAAAVSSLLIAATWVAGPASSAEELGEMPDVSGMVLENAIELITSVTDEKELVVNTSVTTGPSQKQVNMTNWVVCWQSPKAGKPIMDNSWIGVGVRRPNQECYP